MPLGLIEHLELDWMDVIAIESFQSAAIRQCLFVFSISLAVLALAQTKKSYAVMIAASLLIILTLAYGLFIIVETSRALRGEMYYAKFKTIYYYLTIALLFVIFGGVLLWVDFEHLKPSQPTPSRAE